MQGLTITLENIPMAVTTKAIPKIKGNNRIKKIPRKNLLQ
jgi:hypothetical protein